MFLINIFILSAAPRLWPKGLVMVYLKAI